MAKDQRDWVTATNHLWKAKELTRSVNGVVLVSLAYACQAAGDTTNARLFAQLAEAAPDANWDVFDRLGMFHLMADPRHRDLDGALEDFASAVRMAPDEPLPHRYLGQVLLLKGRSAEAHKELERSLLLRRSPNALAALGSAYFAETNMVMAERFFAEASRADPSRYNFHIDAGLALRTDPKTRDEAIEHFTQALRQIDDALSAGGEKALLRAFHGLCLAALGNEKGARSDLELARKEAVDNFLVLAKVRDGYVVLGDKARAAEIREIMRQGGK